jgi:glycine dehydrogenase
MKGLRVRRRVGLRRFSFQPQDVFERRHIGPSPEEQAEMLKTLGCGSMAELITQTLPNSVVRPQTAEIITPLTESDALKKAEAMLSMNVPAKTYLGQGYHGNKVPSAILRNLTSNPGWYTAYTPYQAEISQGRMEALFNYQTAMCELTGMEVANASLLDEATAGAEAVQMCMRLRKLKGTGRILLDANLHPQTIDVIKARCDNFDLQVIVADLEAMPVTDNVICAVVQYPGTNGVAKDFSSLSEAVHAVKGYVIASADPLALAIMKPPSAMGADIAVGSSQRLGVPMWYGGPSAAYFATKKAFVRNMPGRIIGMSKDRFGNPGFRLTLQTREQHIRHDKATSNVCTAQALLANMASMYCAYHGPAGLRQIAGQVKLLQQKCTNAFQDLGFKVIGGDAAFDTVTANVFPLDATWVQNFFLEADLAVRVLDANHISVSFDETHTEEDIGQLVEVMGRRGMPVKPLGLRRGRR